MSPPVELFLFTNCRISFDWWPPKTRKGPLPTICAFRDKDQSSISLSPRGFAMQLTFGAAIVLLFGTASAADSVTFHKDVEPILQKNCQSCHRPGQVGPMSFLTYQGARPWAKAMKAAVA